MENHICKKCGGIAGWDGYFNAWVCTRCGDMERKPITNYDCIISKSPEELAEWIAGDVLNLTGGSLKMATEAWLDWLKQETTNES